MTPTEITTLLALKPEVRALLAECEGDGRWVLPGGTVGNLASSPKKWKSQLANGWAWCPSDSAAIHTLIWSLTNRVVSTRCDAFGHVAWTTDPVGATYSPTGRLAALRLLAEVTK